MDVNTLLMEYKRVLSELILFRISACSLVCELTVTFENIEYEMFLHDTLPVEEG